MKRFEVIHVIYKLLTTAILFVVIASCASNRNLTYFKNIGDNKDYEIPITNSVEPTIQPDDLLDISVSSLNAESNLLFNNGAMQAVSGTATESSASVSKPIEGYLVDKNGSINFPVLGTIKLSGLTKSEAVDKLSGEIRKLVKNPIVNIRFVNFKITVIGEVNRPSTFTVPTERINVLEAIGLAGDMTPYGKRENVLIIREKANVRSATRIDFTNKQLLNSPYFYLQQNDIVYVEPVKAKVLQGSSSNFYLPIVATVASLISVLIFSLR